MSGPAEWSVRQGLQRPPDEAAGHGGGGGGRWCSAKAGSVAVVLGHLIKK